MEGPSKPVIIAAFSAAALFAGVGAYLVFTGQMDSRQFLMIGATIGILGAGVRLVRGY
jgi:hypothetical protein